MISAEETFAAHPAGSQFFTVTATAATTCPLHPPGKGCSAFPNSLHAASKHASQTSTFTRPAVAFKGYEKKISVLNKQNHEDQHPSTSPLSQYTLVLSVSETISGSPGLRYTQCITPYLPSPLSTGITSRSLGKQKYFSSYMKVLFIWEKRTFSNCSAGRNECPKYGL